MSGAEMPKQLGKSQEMSARNKALQHATGEEAMAMIAQYYPRGSTLSAGLAGTIVVRGKTLAQRESILSALQERYSVELGPRMIDLFLHKTADIAEAKTLLETKQKELGVAPDEKTLMVLLNKVEGLDQCKEVMQYFTQKFGSITYSSAMLNTLIERLPALTDAERTIAELAEELNVRPDISTYKVALLKSLSVARPNANTLKDAANLIATVKKFGQDLERDIHSRRPELQIRYARYLFLTQRPQEAIKVLSPMLQATDLDREAKKVILPMIFAFLPEQHPVRVAIEQGLRQRGQHEELVRAIARSEKFDEIFSDWMAHDRRQGYLGGGTVFDQLHQNPVDQQALREVKK